MEKHSQPAKPGTMPSAALRCALELLESSPDFAVAHLQAGRLLAAIRNAGNTTKADGEELDPVMVALRDARSGDAASLLTDMVQREASPESWYGLAVLEFLAGQIDRARASALSALTLGADPMRCHRLLGALAYAQGQIEGAAGAYRKALAVAPDHPELLRNLARVLRAQGRLDDSERLLNTCLRLRWDFAEAQTNRLMTFRARGNPRAERAHATALAMDSNLSAATRAAAMSSLLFLGDSRMLFCAIPSLLAHHPSDPDALRIAVAFAEQMGDTAGAFRLAARLSRMARTPEDWLTTARVCAGTDLPSALRAAQEAHRMAPGIETDLALRDLHDAVGAAEQAEAHARAARKRLLGSFGSAGNDGVRCLRALPNRAFFAGHPAFEAPEPEPEPPTEQALALMDPGIRPASQQALERDRAAWRDGVFVAGPVDFDVLILPHVGLDCAGPASAHIVSAETYVNHRISQNPPRRSAATRAIVPSPITGHDLPDWVVSLDGLPTEEVENAVFIGGHENYGHFLWEILSRVMAAHSFSELRHKPLYALINAPYQRDMLSMVAGEAPLRALAPTPRLVRFRNSYVPRDLSYWSATRLVKAALLRAFGDLDGGGPERVFLSRANHWPSRHRIADETALRDRLARRGFVTVEAAHLSVIETIRLFSGARFIVGATGAQFANLPFAKPGTRLLDLSAAYHRIDGIWHWSLPLIFGYGGVLHRRHYGEDVHIEPGTALNWVTAYDADAVDEAVAALERMEGPPLS